MPKEEQNTKQLEKVQCPYPNCKVIRDPWNI